MRSRGGRRRCGPCCVSLLLQYLLCVAERRATRPNGEWGYSTRRHMLGPERPEAVSPARGVVLTDLQSSIDCQYTSLSLSHTHTPSPCSTSYSLLPLEATRASVHDVKTERARSHNKRDNTSTQYMLYITQYMFCQSVRLRWSRASRDTSCACTTHRPFVFCYGFPRASLSPSLSLTLHLSVSLCQSIVRGKHQGVA